MSARATWIAGLAALVLVLIAARAYAPIALQRYVNRALDRAEGYEGRIGDVDLNLLRGAYEIENVEILKSGGKAPVPLLSSPLVDLSIEWRDDDHVIMTGPAEWEFSGSFDPASGSWVREQQGAA